MLELAARHISVIITNNQILNKAEMLYLQHVFTEKGSPILENSRTWNITGKFHMMTEINS